MDRKEFLKAYGKIVWDLWEKDGKLKDRLLSKPEAVFKEYGLDPGKAAIHVVTAMRKEATPAHLVELWNEGKKTGNIVVYVPLEKKATLADYELSEADLEAVSGGTDACCCCSSPCCCC
jgi:hypothetical protein